MISALGDCVPVLQRVKHEPSPQVMLELFEKEIGDTLHEVSILIKKFLSVPQGCYLEVCWMILWVMNEFSYSSWGGVIISKNLLKIDLPRLIVLFLLQDSVVQSRSRFLFCLVLLVKFNPFTPMSDQERISPLIVNAISSRQVKRIKKNSN